jgi:hypothetical protein
MTYHILYYKLTPPSNTNIQSGTRKNSREQVFSNSKRSHVITLLAQAAGETHKPAAGEKVALCVPVL